MSETMEYKCPNCGGALNFDSDLQKMKCPYCESIFDIEMFQSMDDELKREAKREQQTESRQNERNINKRNVNEENNQGWRDEERKGMKIYSCQSCGAEIIGDETLGATTCPYCGNQVVVKGSFSGDLRPDYVIPFQLNKEEVQKRLQAHLKNKKLLPKVFKDQHHIEEIKAVYVPYWLFDARADADMHYDATKLTRIWQDRDYRYEEICHFDITRKGSMDFHYVPVDGSKKMPDDLMESLEPFDMNEAVDFQTAYLAGYLADRYDVTQEESVDRVKQRVHGSVCTVLENSIQGYDMVHFRQGDVQIRQKDVKYALFPVWILNTSWNGKLYTFAMNGQTGRFIGNLPVDWKKFWMKIALRTVIYGAIIGLGTFLFLFG